MPTLSHFNISDTLFTMGVFLWDKISQCEGEGGAGSEYTLGGDVCTEAYLHH